MGLWLGVCTNHSEDLSMPTRTHTGYIAAGNSSSRIAHGSLISGMISAVIGMKLPGAGTVYLEQDSRFLKPVYIGDTVTAIVEVAEIINRTKGIVKLKTYVNNQDNECVVDGFAIIKAPFEKGEKL